MYELQAGEDSVQTMLQVSSRYAHGLRARLHLRVWRTVLPSVIMQLHSVSAYLYPIAIKALPVESKTGSVPHEVAGTLGRLEQHPLVLLNITALAAVR
eukprot:6214179-Pleurochrysis_carterae.AAC.3